MRSPVHGLCRALGEAGPLGRPDVAHGPSIRARSGAAPMPHGRGWRRSGPVGARSPTVSAPWLSGGAPSSHGPVPAAGHATAAAVTDDAAAYALRHGPDTRSTVSDPSGRARRRAAIAAQDSRSSPRVLPRARLVAEVRPELAAVVFPSLTRRSPSARRGRAGRPRPARRACWRSPHAGGFRRRHVVDPAPAAVPPPARTRRSGRLRSPPAARPGCAGPSREALVVVPGEQAAAGPEPPEGVAVDPRTPGS